MINGKSVIGIVPARAGSKGLPRKNIAPLCGKPLIAWSIEAGLRSQYIDLVIVSTDSNKIASIAAEYGASVPFIRPAELATDKTPTIDVVIHALEYLHNERKQRFDYTVLLEPTSPLRDEADIDRAIKQLVDNVGASSLVGISRTEAQNPEFLVCLSENNFLRGFDQSEIKPVRRQEIKDVYFLEGSIYVSDTKTLITKRTFCHQETLGCIFPKWKSLEVDDLEDLIMVEALMLHKKFQ